MFRSVLEAGSLDGAFCEFEPEMYCHSLLEMGGTPSHPRETNTDISTPSKHSQRVGTVVHVFYDSC